MQKGEVMHIQNQLRSYVLTRHGEGGLLHEFYNYSSFTKNLGQPLFVLILLHRFNGVLK